jgi:hypothetical protein
MFVEMPPHKSKDVLLRLLEILGEQLLAWP